MKEKKLLGLLKNELSNNEEGIVNVNDVISYSMSDVFKRVQRNLQGQFEEPIEADGSEKVFIPLTSWLKDVLARNTDLDTKDIEIISKNGNSGLAMFLRYIVKDFNTENKMGKFINEVLDRLAGEGTVVVKKTGRIPTIIENMNIVKLGVGDIQDTGLIEKGVFHINELIGKKNWKNIDKLKTLAENLIKQGKTPEITIYERWGMFTNSKGELVKGVIISSEANEVKGKIVSSNSPETIHYVKEVNGDYPYKSVILERISNRWWGRGVAEKIFGLQTWINEVANLKIKSDRQTLRGIFGYKTDNPQMSASALSQLETGGIVTFGTGEEFYEMNQRPKNSEFSVVNDATTEWARRVTGGSEISSGEQLPSSMTATVGSLQAKSATTTFSLIKENVGIFLRELYTDWIIPEIIKNISDGQIISMNMNRKDREDFDNSVAEYIANKEISKVPLATKDDYDMLVDAIKKKFARQGNSRYIKVAKKVLTDFKFYVDISITNETFDKVRVFEGLRELLSGYAQIAQGKIDIDEVMVEALDILGMSPRRYIKSDEQIAKEREEKIKELEAVKQIENKYQIQQTQKGQQEQVANA